ncbi:MAG: hypothetical protein IJV84_03640 [Bacteroidales bacterium]|nr:hypothetical protein [Bacteroidales bacterium]MBQ9722596.1 hypothetical protein [Bacteroidales bacterium]
MIKRILILTLAAISFYGCVTTKIIDWVPVTFQIRVQDAQGHDLLDPANDNTWLAGTTIHFRGITVDLDETGITVPETRDYPVTYEGFRLEKGKDYYYLAFGQFEGATDYDEESFTIYWSDNTYNVITYDRRINSRKGGAKEAWKLDGVKCSSPIIIVK